MWIPRGERIPHPSDSERNPPERVWDDSEVRTRESHKVTIKIVNVFEEERLRNFNASRQNFRILWRASG